MSILTSTRRVSTRHLFVAVLGLLVMVGASLAVMPSADAQDGVLEFHTHACIESDTVQGQSAASGLSVGNTFITDDYQSFIIVMGGPTCSLDSSACDSSLNLYLVDDVKACLAQTDAALAALAADAAAPAAAAAAHADSAPSALAHTGVEHELAGAFAISLVGAGCAALGLARSGRRRRNQ